MAKFEGTDVPAGEKPLEGDGWREVGQSARPAGNVEVDAEKKKRLQDFIERQRTQGGKGSTKDSVKEALGGEGEVNDQKQESPFQALMDSPETYFDQLEDIGDANTYSLKKAIGAVMEVLQKLYPDKKQRAKRIQEIFSQYGEIRDEDRKKRPDADKSSSEDFGVNQTTQRLSEIEQQALEKIIEDKVDISEQTFAGTTKHRATKELVLGDFIKFLEVVKK